MNRNEIVIALFTFGLLALLYFLFSGILLYLIFSTVLAIIGSPLMKLLAKFKYKKLSIGKGFAAFVVLGLFIGIITLLIGIIAPIVGKESAKLAAVNPDELLTLVKQPISQLENVIANFTHEQVSIENYLREKVISLLNFANVSNWLKILTDLTGGLLLALFMVAFITFFFLKDGKMFYEQLKSLIPSKYKNESRGLVPEIKNKLVRYFIGIIIEVLLVFICLGIGLYIIDVQYFILIAFIAAMLNVIPYMGPLIGMVLGALISTIAMCTGTSDCLTEILPLIGKVVLVFALVQLLDNIVFQPFIYANSINAHPLEIFLVIIIAGNIWGLLGLLLAVPAWSVLKIIFKEVRKKSQFLNNIYQKEDK